MFKNIIILIAIIICTAAITLALDHMASPPDRQIVEIPPAPVSLSGPAPEFTVTDIKGKEYSLSDFKGKVIVLNFWASWCAPCVKELPMLLEVAEKHQNSVVLLALSSDLTEEAMQRFLQKMRKKHPTEMRLPNVIIALDKKTVITSEDYGVRRLPETLIIDKQGIMREKLAGANWTLDEFSSLVGEYL